MLCWFHRLVEIAEEVEEDQCFLFGHLTPDVDHVRYLNQYEAMPLNERCAELAKVSDLRGDITPCLTDTLASQVFDAIKGGMFGNGGGDTYSALLYTVEHVDHVGVPRRSGFCILLNNSYIQ